jgi:hypothetical protein
MRNDKNSALPAKAGMPWNNWDDDELLVVLRSRKSLKQIANRLERTEEEIFTRVCHHALRTQGE